MAYGYHSQADLDKVAEGVSWWYNWSAVPDDAVKTYYSSLGVEFVPMAWNNNFTVAGMIEQIPAGAKYLLAYNEPNFTVEANITPAQAAAAWYKLEEVAAARNLEIVSAAAAYCGGGVCIPGYESPITWHDEFFAACPDCKVDYIAFHNYEPTVGGLTALVGNMKKYNRPIWVTEFAYWDNATETNKITYLQNAVAAFENDPDIFRYSWFTGRSTPNPSVSLLGADGLLKPLGTAYINADYPTHAVPGKIEVEDIYRRKGTGFQVTTDAGGGQNVGYTDAGTWNEYLVNISATGSYTFRFRVASNVSTGKFNIKLDDQLLKSNVSIASTGGWQTWTDYDVTGVVLTSGQHLIKFDFTETGTNMNYFTTIYEGTVPPIADFKASNVASCTGNQVVFTNASDHLLGAETYAWNFGSGASPATANTVGPHTVTYSTAGQKTISLQVTNTNGTDTETKTNYLTIAPPPTGCLQSDDFDNNTVSWIDPIPHAFTHTEAGTDWTISNNGYGEWSNFTYSLNNGTTASPLNFQCAVNKPVVKIRAKASGNCLLRLTLVDVNGRSVDNTSAIDLELTSTYQTFTINFAGKFRNYNSGSPGLLDSTNITKLQFYVNPGYYTYPITGNNATYNASFPGTIDIDWIGIGNGCSAPVVTDIETAESHAYRISPNPFAEETRLNLQAWKGEKVSLKISNLQGTVVYANDQQNVDETITIGSSLPAGVYIVTAVHGNQLATFKIVKVK
jgi:PKD repeat protein